MISTNSPVQRVLSILRHRSSQFLAQRLPATPSEDRSEKPVIIIQRRYKTVVKSTRGRRLAKQALREFIS